MDTKRQWILITALVSVAVLVAGFMFLVKPQHKKEADLRTQTYQIATQTDSLRTQLADLQDKKRNLAAEQLKLKAISELLPAQASLPTLTRQLDAAAAKAGVELVNVAPGVPAALTATAGTATTTTTGAAGAASQTGTSGAATAASAAMPGLEALPVTLTVSGNFYQVEGFLKQLETMDRALLVDSFSIAQGPGSPAVGAPKTIGAGELTVSMQTRVFMTTAPLPGATTTSTTAQ